MDSLDEGTKSEGYLKKVFSFDEETKAEILNDIQYSLLALIPIILFNKMMNRFVPEADEEKGSLEVSAEVVLQLIAIVVGIYLITKMVINVPTYSGMKYMPIHSTYFMVPIIIIITSLQTKMGDKVNILFNRLVDLWNGKSDVKDNRNKGSVKVSQPISQQQQQQPLQQQSTTMYNDGQSTSISSLPMAPQQLPDYNAMYKNDANPLMNAATPGYDTGGIMPANEAFGGFGGFSGF